jgi:hypothetical protein
MTRPAAVIHLPAIAPEQTLPRSDVRQGELCRRTAAWQPGLEPLPKELELLARRHAPQFEDQSEIDLPHYSLRPDSYPINTHRVLTAGASVRAVETPHERRRSSLRNTRAARHPTSRACSKAMCRLSPDIFLNLTASTQTEVEFRRCLLPAGVLRARRV